MKKIVICAIGNPWRGDDAAGIHVAQKLENNFHVLFCEANPENFIDEIKEIKPEYLIIVDAADFNGKPGEVRRISPEEIDRFTLSTHTIPLSLFIELVRPYCKNIEIWGIQAKNTEFGQFLTEEVQEGVNWLVNHLKNFYKALK